MNESIYFSTNTPNKLKMWAENPGLWRIGFRRIQLGKKSGDAGIFGVLVVVSLKIDNGSVLSNVIRTASALNFSWVRTLGRCKYL